MLLTYLLRHLVSQGTLRVIDAQGTVQTFAGGDPGPTITIRLRDRSLGRKLFLDFLGANMNLAPHTLLTPLYNGFGRAFRVFQQYNPLRRARANVAHHYDLSDTLYDLFLDADRQYSCAYFLVPDQGIEEAQANKKRHLAAKLLLRPGQKVLDIGCGWGGLALYLARECDVSVTGLTLSSEQLKVARQRAEAAGLADRVRFELCDYREAEGRYDRIVSVGMFEHVGVVHYPTFFRKVK